MALSRTYAALGLLGPGLMKYGFKVDRTPAVELKTELSFAK